MTSIDTPVVFDPFEDGFNEWPYDQYARLRTADPVHHSDLLQGWMLTRYDDVAALLRDDARTSVEIDHATPTDLTRGEIERRDDNEHRDPPLPLLDGDDHRRIRALMAPPFRARVVRDLAPIMQRHVDQMLDAFLDANGPTGVIDLVGDFAYPLPVTVFCELLGVPEEDSPKFREWCHLVALGLDPVIDDVQREICMQGSNEMREYLDVQTAEKRRHPGDDILSQLVQYEEDGDRLTHGELLAQLQTLYIAGHEPTTSVIGNGMLGLLRHPDELARLRADPSLLSGAVLELLRYDGPNQFVRRIALDDLDFGEYTVPAGAVLYPCVGAANHDPAHWGDDAEALRIDRAEARSHLQLGAGIHACLGTHLSRLQIEIALRAVLDRFSSLELAGEVTWVERMVLRSVESLPLSYVAA